MKHFACITALSFAALAAQAQDLPGRVEDANPDNPVLAPQGALPPPVDDGEAHGLPHPVVAEDGPAQFISADTNHDGVLSIEEAREALPNLVVVDINSDGLVNHSEAENALPGLQLAEEGERTSSDAVVGREQYDMMVQHLSEQEARNQALRGEGASEPEVDRSTAGRGL